MPLTKEAYRNLIREDLTWLESVPRTLERDHVIAIVKASEAHEYGSQSSTEELTETKRKLALAEVELKAQNEKNLHTMLALGTEMEMRKAAESRAKELEGLIVLARTSSTISLLLDQDIECVPPTTLGESIPRKDQWP